jgi:hypothetical protein
MGAGLRIDELGRDTETVIGAPDAALKYITHAKLAPELGNINCLTLVLKGSVASENPQIPRPRQLC